MAVDSATTVNAFDTTLPTSSDFVSEGDDNFRHVKSVLKTTFPNLGGAWNATPTEANYIVGVTSPIQTQLNTKGAIAGQTWTGTHVFPSTTTVGSVTPTIFGYLVNLTSDAQAQITARAIKAGDTYSGTHNFTGANINVPTLPPGSSGNGAASVDYANTLAFATALPAQSGNSGKLLTTNGTTASWTFAINASSINGGPLGGLFNRIINGNFSINQRAYVSGAATTAGQYTFDRWKVTGTGGITFATTNNKTTVTIPSGQTIRQVVEGLSLQTGTYVLSWEGTAQGKINGGSYGASGAVTASITGGTNTTIEFNAGTVANIQLEIGTRATPFENRPYELERVLCARYCQLLKQVVVRNQFNTGFVNEWVSFSAMRAIPTFTLQSTTYTNGSSGAGNAASITGLELAFSASSVGGLMITDVLLDCEL